MRFVKRTTCLVGLSALLVLYGGCGNNDGGGNNNETQGEICTDNVDNDDDGDIDCFDSDCDGRTCGDNGLVCDQGVCVCPGGDTENVCDDSQDDDCDGLTDCNDPDCATDTACAEDISIYDFATASNELTCEVLMSCENMGAWFDNQQECLDYTSNDFPAQYLEEVIEAVGAGNVTYNGVAAGACLVALQGLGCEYLRSPVPAICEDVFSGNLSNLDNCHLDEECVDGWCDQRNGCPGVCATPAGDGDSCASGQKCDFNLYCDAGTCEPHPGPLAENATCDPAFEFCAYALYCDENTEECTSRKPTGENCVEERECAPGHMCNADDECVPYQVLQNIDDDCDPRDGRVCDALDGLVCPWTMILGEGLTYTLCRQGGQEGESCGTGAIRYPCDPTADLYCKMDGMSGNCAFKEANGEACNPASGGSTCMSGFCAPNGECAPPDLPCWAE